MNTKELYDSINQLPSVLGWQGHGAKVMIAKDSVLELVRQLDDSVIPGEEVSTDNYDTVKKPKHYQGKFGLEAMTVVENFIGELSGKAAYCWGNVVKYLLRFQQKNGVEDLKKARQHLDWLIEEQEVVE